MGLEYATGALEQFPIGGGDLYFYPISILTPLSEFPTDEDIEQPQYNVGLCSKGFTISDKPKITTLEDSMGNTIRNFSTSQKLTLKTGFTSWNLANLKLLSTATYTTNPANTPGQFGSLAGEQVTTFQGCGQLPIFIVRLVNNSLPYGQTIRFTTVAQPTSGFDLNFNEKPNAVDAEMTSIYMFKGFMANVRQAAPTLPASSTPSIITSSGTTSSTSTSTSTPS